MKRVLFLLLLMPFTVEAQDTADAVMTPEDKVYALEQKDFALHPERKKYAGRIDTIFTTNPETGEKEIAALKLRPLDYEYKTALEWYKKGDYAKAHLYAFQTLQKPKGLSKKRLLELYDLAIKSSYSNREFSSAIVYYQDLVARKFKPDDELTKLAIFSYFPIKALQTQEYYNINPKDTSFVLSLVNKMVAKDPKWLMVRSKIYGSIRDVDALPDEVRTRYKAKMEADIAKYTAEFKPGDWEDILP